MRNSEKPLALLADLERDIVEAVDVQDLFSIKREYFGEDGAFSRQMQIAAQSLPAQRFSAIRCYQSGRQMLQKAINKAISAEGRVTSA